MHKIRVQLEVGNENGAETSEKRTVIFREPYPTEINTDQDWIGMPIF